MAASILLDMVKARLNRTDSALDDYLTERIHAAIDELTGAGIHLEATAGDNMLVVDLTVWRYQNRDKGDEQPKWLRQTIRDRWIQDKGGLYCDS